MDDKTLEKNIKSLNEIARRLGKRSTAYNLIDPQVHRSPWDWRDVFSDKPTPSDHFTRKVSYKVNSLRVILRVNDEYLVADVIGLFGSSVVCSIVNNKVSDPSRILASNALCKGYGCKVFVDSSINADNTISFLQNSSFKRLVNELRLSPKESLHIGNGWASLYLLRFACDDVLKTLGTLYQLLAILPSTDETPTSFEDMPERFRALIPFIKRWAISDDDDRSEKLGKTSSRTLTRLVQVVSPNFGEINQYLDSFANRPLPEHAILLGTLAECVTEAQLILGARD